MAKEITSDNITLAVGDLISHMIGEQEVFNRIYNVDTVEKKVTLIEVNSGDSETVVLASMLISGIRNKAYAQYGRKNG